MGGWLLQSLLMDDLPPFLWVNISVGQPGTPAILWGQGPPAIKKPPYFCGSVGPLGDPPAGNHISSNCWDHRPTSLENCHGEAVPGAHMSSHWWFITVKTYSLDARNHQFIACLLISMGGPGIPGRAAVISAHHGTERWVMFITWLTGTYTELLQYENLCIMQYYNAILCIGNYCNNWCKTFNYFKLMYLAVKNQVVNL